MLIQRLLFVLVILCVFQNSFAEKPKYSVLLYKLEAKKGIDTNLVHSLSSSIYKEIEQRSSIRIADTILSSELLSPESFKDFDYCLKGFIGKIQEDYFLLHLKLIKNSSGENVRTLNMDFNGTVEELEGAIVKKSVDILFEENTDQKEKNSGKLSLYYQDNSNKKRNQVIRRVIAGVATAGFTAAGIITNMQLNDLEDEYNNSNNGSQAYYNNLWNDIEIHSKRRNSFYGAASGAAILLLVSIPF